MSIADLRKEYRLAALDESAVDASPLKQLQHWLNDAIQAQLLEPTAMTLATVDEQFKPSARIVLLKDLNDDGLGFFTNYESRKGCSLAVNPQAALLFFWVELERQVRVEGVVSKMSPQESDAYYESRPLGSRLGAWASPQSRVVRERAVLEQALAEVESRFGEHPPRPPHWGGYRLIPSYVEFWQGRPSRLHDRIAFRRASPSDDWVMERLAP